MVAKIRDVLDLLSRYEVVLREAEGLEDVFEAWGVDVSLELTRVLGVKDRLLDVLVAGEVTI